ncbi:acylneuraminate cytidylyltransferase [Meiothermus sp. QL-1]|uniref:molybdenum cofactor guanylyltransferase n=1 Tax=Meiothermus sp. QL-1 TaxID=2058095 RepID=UPI000E0C8955|nr:NTP transferase domain-containing protein [Meiothermus sp. QL-1]RDI95085.1 acylneuraminate cytidylyltransferase [Meiothermus sp. QL-1]
MEAIVLAGGRPDDPLAKKFGVASKALLPYRGRPLVEHTLQALQQAGLELILVGPPGAYTPAPSHHLGDQGSLLANLKAGLEAARSERVLVATGDMPLLSKEAVRWVVDNAPVAAFVYPIVPRALIEARFPGMRRTYARVREGTFTGGNLVLLDKKLFHTALPLLQQALALRKNPLALARLIGLGTLFGVLLGKASIPVLEARVSSLLKAPVRALITPYPEVGVDVDQERDLAWLDRV